MNGRARPEFLHFRRPHRRNEHERRTKNSCPRPLGGEGGAPPAFSPAGARRVRGSAIVKAGTNRGPCSHRWGRTGASRDAHHIDVATSEPLGPPPEMRRTSSGRVQRQANSTPGLNPLTRLGVAGESATPIHPLPQGGEGKGLFGWLRNLETPRPHRNRANDSRQDHPQSARL
jgi:hypothetical protein